MANTYDPTTGEQPLTELPQWTADRDNVTQNSQFYAGQAFIKQFGRNPTQSELSLLAPTYDAGKGNLNLAAGNAQVASYYQQQANTPQNLYKQQQNQLAKDAPKFADQINQTFQSNLGRDATDAEKAHFGALMAGGNDAYQVGQALQSTSEYQATANAKFQGGLKDQLQASNNDYFNKYILPSLQTNNAMQGRSQDSSGYQAQIANAGNEQNYNLNDFLANASAQNYGNSVQNANSQYQSLMGQQYGLQNAGVSNALSNQYNNQQSNQNMNMYNLQQQAYGNYINRYGKNSAAGGAMAGAASGAAAGTAIMPGWGTAIGAVAGGVSGYLGAKM